MWRRRVGISRAVEALAIAAGGQPAAKLAQLGVRRVSGTERWLERLMGAGRRVSEPRLEHQLGDRRNRAMKEEPDVVVVATSGTARAGASRAPEHCRHQLADPLGQAAAGSNVLVDDECEPASAAPAAPTTSRPARGGRRRAGHARSHGRRGRSAAPASRPYLRRLYKQNVVMSPEPAAAERVSRG